MEPMKKTIQQIFTPNGVAKQIGISSVRFYEYIKENKVEADYFHLSSGGSKFYYFNRDSVKDIKRWHSDFRKSKAWVLPKMDAKTKQ